MKNEPEEIPGLSDKSPQHLHREFLGPRLFKAFRKIASEKRETDAFVAKFWVMLDLFFEVILDL